MRTLIEVRQIKEGTEDDENPMYETSKWWLWHFALKYELINNSDGSITAVNYTVCVCENYDTGQLECFPPEAIRILGTQIKK